jgi:hypothetical protein
MSQSDWNFILANANTFIGGTSGSAKLHTDFSNPLTSSGDWCRYFQPDNGVQSYRQLAMIPVGNSELTSSSGYEYGYAYSMRIWFRANWNGQGVLLTFKNASDLVITYPPDPFQNMKNSLGYGLYCSSNGYLTLFCNSINAVANNDSLDPAYNAYGYSKDISVSTTNNIWKGMRMDISPISGAYDKITVYTAERTTPNTWTEQYTVNIPRTKTGAYIPWANNPNGDGAAASGKGYMRIRVWARYDTAPVSIDQFEVYKQRIIP